MDRGSSCVTKDGTRTTCLAGVNSRGPHRSTAIVVAALTAGVSQGTAGDVHTAVTIVVVDDLTGEDSIIVQCIVVTAPLIQFGHKVTSKSFKIKDEKDAEPPAATYRIGPSRNWQGMYQPGPHPC